MAAEDAEVVANGPMLASDAGSSGEDSDEDSKNEFYNATEEPKHPEAAGDAAELCLNSSRLWPFSLSYLAIWWIWI